MPKNQNTKDEIDWEKLATPDMKEKYLVAVCNKYETLSLEMGEQGQTISESDS